MAKIKFNRKDSRGAALVMVIVAVLLVSIIASLILGIVNDNLESMEAYSDEDKTFYSAEEVVDELCVRLGEYADTAMRGSYEKWLQVYSTLDADEQEDRFLQLFNTRMYKLLLTDFVQPLADQDTDKIEAILYTAYSSSNVKVELSGDGSAEDHIYPTLAAITADISSSEHSSDTLTLKGLKVTFTDADGNASVITTDIEFNVTYPGFTVTAASGSTLTADNLLCTDYIIVSDGNVKITGTTELSGNVCAIDGITLTDNSTNVTAYADKFISGSDILIKNGAELTVKGSLNSETNTYGYSNIWSKNITLTADSGNNDKDPAMTVQGIVRLKDDLTLDATSSSFVMTGSESEYYGYMTYNGDSSQTGISSTWTGTADGSSAIIVNGYQAVLDLSAAKDVWIAGKAFIVVPEVFGTAVTSQADNSYLEGESISYRGQQAAYLLPGEALVGIGHNPVTYDELQLLTDTEDGVDPTPDYNINLNISPSRGDLRIADFVISSQPYRIAKVKYTGNGEDRYYLYLNFQDADKAAQFFANYFALMTDMINTRMATFTGRISVNDDTSTLHTTGNVIVYDSATDSEPTLLDYTETFVSSSIIDKEYDLSNRYTGLLTALNESYMGVGTAGTLVSSLLDWTEVAAIRSYESEIVLDSSPNASEYGDSVSELALYLGDASGNVTISGGVHAGIILAEGNVTLDSARFYGLIIAKGNVTVNGDCKLVCKKDIINQLVLNGGSLAYSADSSFSLDEIFSPAATTYTVSMRNGGNGDAYDLIDIKYKNWRKN